MKMTRRQQKQIEEAEGEVTDAKIRIVSAEEELSEARQALRIAERNLHRIYEMGDCL